MSDNDVDTLDKEDQNTNTEEHNNESNDDIDNESKSEVDSSTEELNNESEAKEDKEERLLQEQLDAMDDDAFNEYLNSGKLNLNKVKTDTSKESNNKEDKQTTGNKESVDNKKDKTSIDDKKVDNKKESTNINFEEVYKAIFKPFKANGKEITPKTVEDIVGLMQMGANYTKKMQLMAPMKKAVESLNKAEINESELNFLIDVYKGDKEAIKKLLQKHKVDPIELDMDKTNYVPNKNNIVSNEDVEYSLALDDIESSIPKINEILTTKWDAESKKTILSDPNLVRALHEEIEHGRFDEVQNRLELERTFGRYKGVSDIKAYIDIVNKMKNDDKTKTSTSNATNNNVNNTNKSTNTVNNKAKAAPTRNKQSTQGTTTLTAKDLLSMSEEEFTKLSMRDLV